MLDPSEDMFVDASACDGVKFIVKDLALKKASMCSECAIAIYHLGIVYCWNRIISVISPLFARI